MTFSSNSIRSPTSVEGGYTHTEGSDIWMTGIGLGDLPRHSQLSVTAGGEAHKMLIVLHSLHG